MPHGIENWKLILSIHLSHVPYANLQNEDAHMYLVTRARNLESNSNYHYPHILLSMSSVYPLTKNESFVIFTQKSFVFSILNINGHTWAWNQINPHPRNKFIYILHILLTLTLVSILHTGNFLNCNKVDLTSFPFFLTWVWFSSVWKRVKLPYYLYL